MAQDTTHDKLTKEELEHELEEATDHIERHLEALQDEFTTLGPSLGKAIFSHPLVSVGGALLAGLAVGLIFGGRKRPDDPFGGRAAHRALVERYVEALVEAARQQVQRGQEPGEAVRAVLEDRVPVIVLETDAKPVQPGFLRQTAQILFRSIVGLGMTAAVNYLSNRLITPSSAESGERKAGPADAAVATATVSENME